MSIKLHIFDIQSDRPIPSHVLRRILTFALASRDASASAAIALCIDWGSLTSFSSTLSTLMPHSFDASYNTCWIGKTNSVT